MKKNEFIEKLNIEDKNLAGYIYDKYKLAVDTGMKVSSEEFYPPNIWTKLENIKGDILIKINSIEVFPNSERRQIAFVPIDSEYYEIENPVILVKLTNTSNFKKLEHKDFLGAIMSLGIKRELLSDLILKEQTCYFLTNNTIASLIEENLPKVGKNPIKFQYAQKEEIPQIDFEYIDILSSSMRLDGIISSLCKFSRSEAVEKIEKKEVSINYIVKSEKSLVIKENDVISIRKFGKYILEGELGKSKKDKLRLRFKKFT